MFARQFVGLVTILLCYTCAQAQSLEGTWVTILHPTGLVYPHLEELRVDRHGGFTTTIYGRREDSGVRRGSSNDILLPGSNERQRAN